MIPLQLWGVGDGAGETVTIFLCYLGESERTGYLFKCDARTTRGESQRKRVLKAKII